MDNVWCRHEHDQDAIVAQADELDMLQAVTRQGRRDHDAYIIRKSREQMRGPLHQPVRRIAGVQRVEPVFLADLKKIVVRDTEHTEQIVNVKTIASVCGNPAGRGVGLLEHSQFL